MMDRKEMNPRITTCMFNVAYYAAFFQWEGYSNPGSTSLTAWQDLH